MKSSPLLKFLIRKNKNFIKENRSNFLQDTRKQTQNNQPINQAIKGLIDKTIHCCGEIDKTGYENNTVLSVPFSVSPTQLRNAPLAVPKEKNGLCFCWLMDPSLNIDPFLRTFLSAPFYNAEASEFSQPNRKKPVEAISRACYLNARLLSDNKYHSHKKITDKSRRRIGKKECAKVLKSIDWLIDWLGWSIDWLIDWLIRLRHEIMTPCSKLPSKTLPKIRNAEKNLRFFQILFQVLHRGTSQKTFPRHPEIPQHIHRFHISLRRMNSFRLTGPIPVIPIFRMVRVWDSSVRQTRKRFGWVRFPPEKVWNFISTFCDTVTLHNFTAILPLTRPSEYRYFPPR